MTLLPDEFPRLTPDNHRETSPETDDCNCVAWAIEHDTPEDVAGGISGEVVEVMKRAVGSPTG